MKIQRLVSLFHHRWSVPILAELHRLQGAKFVTLVHKMGASRDSLRRSLDALIDQGFVMRNPGYGHPMRPEYLLTAQGAKLAPVCAKLLKILRRLGLERMGLCKWTLMVTVALRRSGGRFSEVKAFLPGITARALTLALKALQDAALVERTVTPGYPPRTSYRLTPRGRRLAPVVESL